MTQEKENMYVQSIFIRGLYTILYLIAGKIAMFFICTIAIFQFFYTLIAREKNSNILNFSKGLSVYIKDISDFVMMHTERKPWPLNDWKK